MIRVHFKKVRWKNLMSYGNTWTEVQLDRSPSTMILGKNGQGKSSIIEALCFSLFGKPYRKINKPDLVNTKNGRELLTEVEFTVVGQDYLVRRGIKPDTFEIWRDGELIKQDGTTRDYQKQLESIIRMDYASACQIVFVGKAQHRPFMQLDAAGRRKFVEVVLNLSVFSNMAKLLVGKLADYRNHISELKTAVSITQEKAKMRKRYIDDLSKADKEAAEADVARLNQLLAEANEKIAGVVVKQEALGVAPANVKAEIRATIAELSKLNGLVSGITSKIRTIGESLESTATAQVCYACKREMDTCSHDAQKAELKAKIAELEAAMVELQPRVEDAEARHAELEERNTRYEAFNDAWNSLVIEMSAAEQTKKHVEADLSKERVTNTDKISAAKKELKDLVNMHKALVDKLQTQQEKYDYYELIASLLTDKGVKAMIIKRFVPIINHAANTHLSRLGLFANFHLDENFGETIKMRGFDSLGYNSFSEGEKLRMDMALLLAWREIARLQGNVSTNLLFFDEIVDSSMDDTGIDALSDLLNEVKNMNVFIITHAADKLIDKVRSVIRIENTNGFSRLV